MLLAPVAWQASLLVADSTVSFEITGLGDVLEPKDGVIAIGSGGTYALGELHGRCFGCARLVSVFEYSLSS